MRVGLGSDKPVEGDSGGHGHVQRVDRGSRWRRGHPNTDGAIRCGQGLWRQAGAFRTQQESAPGRWVGGDGLKVGRIEPRGQSKHLPTGFAEAGQFLGPTNKAAERHSQDVPHRNPKGLAVERIGTTWAKEDRAPGAAEARRVSENGTEVVVVDEVFEDKDRAGTGEQVVERERFRPAPEGEYAAVHVEPDDAVEEGLRRGVDRRVGGEAVQVGGEGVAAVFGEEDRGGGEGRVDQPSDHEFALGHEEGGEGTVGGGGVGRRAMGELGIAHARVRGEAGVGEGGDRGRLQMGKEPRRNREGIEGSGRTTLSA